MSNRVKTAVKQVTDAVHSAGSALNDTEFCEFLEELCAEAEGWEIQIKEIERENRGD